MGNFIGKKIVCFIIWAVYLLFIFYITLFSRSFGLIRTSNLELFWSYSEWIRGNVELGRVILLNILLFVPLGFFLSNLLSLLNKKRIGLISIGISIIISATIEGFQYVGGLGLCEIDDLINNGGGAYLGVLIHHLLVRYCSSTRLPYYKTALSLLFLLAGVVGCNMVTVSQQDLMYQTIMQYDFDITHVESDSNVILFKGYCRTYGQETPAYKIIMKEETTGKTYRSETKIAGNYFTVSVPGVADEKFDVLVKFKWYSPWKTFTYVTKDRITYVSGMVEGPDIQDTDLGKIVNSGILKAYEPEYDVYVYQLHDELYWVIGSTIDKRTEIVFHLHTNEYDKLPEHRKKYKFDNRGFSADSKTEITDTMRCGKYRVFEREIPAEYNITGVMTGFYSDKKMKWSRWFRVKKEAVLAPGFLNSRT